VNNLLKILLIVSLLTTAATQADEMILEIIPMQHRMVEEIIPIIKPLVAAGGTVTGMNNQLIVKTTPSNLAEIKQILGSIDQSPRKLMISVKQDIDGNINIKESGIAGSYTSGDVSVSAGETGHPGGLVIEGRDDDGNIIQYRTQNSQTRLEDKNVFRVQTLEGHPAYITTGQSIPFANQTAYMTPGGVVIREGIEYQDFNSGFYVLPRLQDDQVTLFVSPQLSRGGLDQGSVFDYQNIETTARGRLGEWISLGGTTENFSDNSNRNLSSTRAHGQERRAVLIKVDEIK
jgi:type II secretory pathway component GspD/PulD (secretin)